MDIAKMWQSCDQNRLFASLPFIYTPRFFVHSLIYSTHIYQVPIRHVGLGQALYLLKGGSTTDNSMPSPLGNIELMEGRSGV